jgi:hypothetical protein
LVQKIGPVILAGKIGLRKLYGALLKARVCFVGNKDIDIKKKAQATNAWASR